MSREELMPLSLETRVATAALCIFGCAAAIAGAIYHEQEANALEESARTKPLTVELQAEHDRHEGAAGWLGLVAVATGAGAFIAPQLGRK